MILKNILRKHSILTKNALKNKTKTKTKKERKKKKSLDPHDCPENYTNFFAFLLLFS